MNSLQLSKLKYKKLNDNLRVHELFGFKASNEMYSPGIPPKTSMTPFHQGSKQQDIMSYGSCKNILSTVTLDANSHKMPPVQNRRDKRKSMCKAHMGWNKS